MVRLVSACLFVALVTTLFPQVYAQGSGSAVIPTVKVVEYYHAGLDHYFITASEAEQRALDSGATQGWQRTGFAFEAFAPSSAANGVSPVCRFYGRPDAGLDSHFYSASPNECAEVAKKFAAAWIYESGNVFRIALPDATSGSCPSGTFPIYRLLNNRADTNHRYTGDETVRDHMVESGFIPEGYGPDSVAFCAAGLATAALTTAPQPVISASPTATITVTPVAADTFTFTGAVYSVSGTTIVSRTWAHGDGTTASGTTSTHKYAATGTYTVSFTARDSAGNTATTTKTVSATAAPPPEPAPSAPTVTIAVVTLAPDTFSFSSTAAAAPGATIVGYAWNFGDGTSGSGATATHQYNADGNYLVKLTVTDSRGLTGTASKNVTASKLATTPAPIAAPAPGTWIKYNTSYEAGNEAEYQNWYNLAWDSKRNVAYGVSWGGVISAFDPTRGVWTKLTPDIGGGVHNRVLGYDPINDRVWLGSGTGSQLVGFNYYDPNNRQWVNHPMTTRAPGSEAAMIFDDAGKRFVVFGGWQRIPLSTFSLNPVANQMTAVSVSGGPSWATEASRMTQWRTALDTRRNRILYVDIDGSLWALPLSLTGWQRLTPAGTPPPVLTQYVYDASVDALVGWASSPRLAGGDTTPGTHRETWLLPLASMTWLRGASAADGVFVPTDSTYVGYALIYDPMRQQVILHTAQGNFNPSTWAYKAPTNLGTVAPPSTPTPPPTTETPPATTTPGTTPTAPFQTSYGTITSFPLPADRNAPYSSINGSKHTNMAFAPTTGRLYVQGGDWLHSATDGTWSMSLVDGSWRQDVGVPIYPTRPAPHALQDGAGFEWVAKRGKFLIWPGAYFAYEAVGTPIREYSKGVWWFDPATNTYTQDLRLFGTYGESSGSPHGGIYDEVHDQIVLLLDSGKGMAARRWDVSTMTKLPDIPLSIRPPSANPAYKAHYFTRSKFAKIGRHVYMVGYSTDGVGTAPRFWRWHLDNHTLEDLAPPPTGTTKIDPKETRLGASNGKVVWPFHNGPEGELHGIFVYNPSTNSWIVDRTVPPYGVFIANAVTSLPDGRVAFSGGGFGRQQTHIWFYLAK